MTKKDFETVFYRFLKGTKDTKIWICNKCRTYPCILELDARQEPMRCPLGAGTGLPLTPEWISKEER